jgi:hypothetical protein
MKTLKLLLPIYLLTIISLTSEAQLKVLTQKNKDNTSGIEFDNLGSTAMTTLPTSNDRSVIEGAFIRFTHSTNTLTIDLTPADPRLFSSSREVVFYNTDAGGFDDIQVKTCYEYSDANAKTDIHTITNSLDKIRKLQGVNFKWIQSKQDEDISLKSRTNASCKDKLNAGLIAQEVEAVIPEAVINNNDGHKLISYSSIIPYLIEALKEQQLQIEKLQHDYNLELKSALSDHQLPTVDLNETGILYQNTPNPFTEKTVIKYFLSDKVKKATIYIYDLEGKQIRSISLHKRGEANEIINGSEFGPGMYIYALIADGELIDSKKLILIDK